MSDEDDEFLRMAEECGVTAFDSFYGFNEDQYIALCKKVQDKQREKDAVICIELGVAANGPKCADAILNK